MKYIIEAWVSPKRNTVYAYNYINCSIPEDLSLCKKILDWCDPLNHNSIMRLIGNRDGLVYVVVEFYVVNNTLTSLILTEEKCRDFGHLKTIWKGLRCETPD